MTPTVLIVDDDKVWLRLLHKKLEDYAGRFDAQTAENSEMAIEVLRRQPIDLVVTDLQMPGMGGLALLAYLSEFYPDIPVIIVTAYSTPNSKKAVLENGAAGYLEKPFIVDDLAHKILAALEKVSEGGTLRSVQLSTFAQLLEMEQKTCTIRVQQKNTTQHGVLFFSKGVLMEARVAGQRGQPAAYEIFSWPEVVLAIEDSCVVKDKRVGDDLQAILLEAMHRRDELPAASPAPTEVGDDGSGASAAGQPRTAAPGRDDAPALPPSASLPADKIQQLQQVLGTRQRINSYTDHLWNELLARAQWVGELLQAGDFRAGYIDIGKNVSLFLIPGERTQVIEVNRRFSPDRVLKALLD